MVRPIYILYLGWEIGYWSQYFPFIIIVEKSVTLQPWHSLMAAIDIMSERLKTKIGATGVKYTSLLCTILVQQVGIAPFYVMMSLLLNVQVEECAHYQGPFYKHGLTLIPPWWVITCSVKCRMQLITPSQISMVHQLKFWNGKVRSCYT